MHRRTFLASAPTLPLFVSHAAHAAAPDVDAPAYKTRDAELVIHSTAGYPQKWKAIYKNTIEHYAKQWGRVGPTHVFLVENTDWDPATLTDKRKSQLEASLRSLKQEFATLQGHNSDGQYLDWQTGNHWAGWSIKPAHLTITMTMTPLRDAQQFVIGPIHEYTHAIQTAYGFSAEAIDGNQMGHSRWTGPAWWREGSAVLISYLYSYQHPQLFQKLQRPMTWQRFSHEMNRNLSLYQKANTSIRSGVTHDDWQRLENINKVHPVVYAGGSIACAALLKRAGTLAQLFKFLHKVPELGWEQAFEQHFQLSLETFYQKFEDDIANAKPQMDSDEAQTNWAAYLQDIK